MTFNAYIKSCVVLDTPAGDFIYDCQRDKHMPGIVTWPELDTYLTKVLAGAAHSDDVCAAAHEVWAGYLRSRSAGVHG